RRRFFNGRPVRRQAGSALPDVAWFGPEGKTMTEDDWESQFGRALMLFVNGHGIHERGPRGEERVDSSFLLCFNAHDATIEFAVRGTDYGEQWRVLVDTSRPGPQDETTLSAQDRLLVPDRSMLVLERVES